MPRILLTAFEPYDVWSENSSWLTLVELTHWLDFSDQVVTRRYPVDLSEMAHRLEGDLTHGFDYAVHLGQSPGSPAIKLETTGLNSTDQGTRLVASGPAAYRTTLPLQRWEAKLRGEGIPALVSHHAGTYLCNAALYLSQHFAEERALPTRSFFIHLPLAPQQVSERLGSNPPLASMSLQMMAYAISLVLTDLLTTLET